jgi:two-component system, NtrC family, response regulator AtoC
MVHPITERPAPARRFEVVVHFGTKVDVISLPVNGVLGLGRSPESSIRINDPAVSRQHLQLCTDGDRVEVVDLGSANGTLLLSGRVAPRSDDVTNQRLTPYLRCPLEIGDNLRIGPAVVTLQLIARPELSAGERSPGEPPVLLEPAMLAAYELVTRAARTDITVLILGETGVGKEVMAETVHRRSRRAGRRFLLLNCAALPENLLESELFGHERGAFTGAQSAKVGLLEATDGGTVFLDEIGELPLPTQAKLLRVLEERRVLRVGATSAREIDVRFLTATNRDLARLVREGHFRADLYHRISGLVVRIPALRDRPSEIVPLARFFLRQFCERTGSSEPVLSPEALTDLQGHRWPGNVRELKNVMERATLLSEGNVVRPEHLALDPEAPSSPDTERRRYDDATVVGRDGSGVLADANNPERREVLEAIEACAGNQTRAAKLLGVSRQTLINRLVKWNLPRPQKR